MRRISPWKRGIAIGIAALGLAVGTDAVLGLRDRAAPIAQWLVDGETIAPLAVVRADAAVCCALELAAPTWTYAVVWNPHQGCLALLPSQQLRSDLPSNPLPAGRHALPGHHLGSALRWTLGDDGGPTTVIVLASETRLRDLEADLSRLRQVGNAAFPQRAELGTYAPQAGMSAVPPRTAPPPAEFRTALASEALEHDGPMIELQPGLWASTLRLQIPVTPPDSAAIRDQLRELEEQLGPTVAAPDPGARGR